MNRLEAIQDKREHASREYTHNKYLGKVRDAQHSSTSDRTVFKPEINLLKQATVDTANTIIRFSEVTGRTNPTTHFQRKLFKELDAYELAYITIKHCFNTVTPINSGKFRPFQNQCISLGYQIQAHFNYLRFVQNMPGYAHVVLAKLKSATQLHKNRALTNIMGKKAETIQPKVWTEDQLHAIGRKLIELFVVTATKEERFYIGSIPNTQKGRKPELTLRMTTSTIKWLEGRHEDMSWLRPQKLAMIIPPKDWTDPHNGGYLNNEAKHEISLIKTKNINMMTKLNESLKKDNPEKLYKGINLIQQTPWCINKEVLDVLITFEDGGRCGIPEMDVKENIPEKTWDDDKKVDPEILLAWKRKAADAHRAFHQETSKRIAFIFQRDEAKANLKWKRIYFPITCDWRTRNYPEPWFLHPQGDDIGRGLLKFTEGKQIELGSQAASWLMVHAANCYGEDHCSYTKRVQWVEVNKAKIRHSAQAPTDELWWSEADKPWQFLAVCFELEQLWATGMVYTQLPVQMDGTCNGLQNFSMLMKDEIGGAAVNLINHEEPADIYNQVRDVTLTLLHKDAIDVTCEDQELARAWIQAGITRKLVKRNVMTLPYGASLFGFSEQLLTEVKKMSYIGRPYLPEDIMFNCCRYLARINRKAISMVVVKSVECMDWLQEVTRIIAKAGHTVKWKTPLGVTVEQANKKQFLKRVSTYWGEVRIRVGLKKDTDELAGMKMKNGIAPNFIHSLDASHLILTVLAMKEQGIENFSMIHDSYGTLAPDIPVMQQCIRKAFYEMYSKENLLEKFFIDVTQDLPQDVLDELPPWPAQGSLDMADVLDSDYFFS